MIPIKKTTPLPNNYRDLVVHFLAEVMRTTIDVENQAAFQRALQTYCDSLRPWLAPTDGPPNPRVVLSLLYMPQMVLHHFFHGSLPRISMLSAFQLGSGVKKDAKLPAAGIRAMQASLRAAPSPETWKRTTTETRQTDRL